MCTYTVLSYLTCIVIILLATDENADIVVPWTQMGLPSDFTAGAVCSWTGENRSLFTLRYRDKEGKGTWKLKPSSAGKRNIRASGFGQDPFCSRDRWELMRMDRFGHGSMMKLEFTDTDDPPSHMVYYGKRASTGTAFFKLLSVVKLELCYFK
jgi:hypothetical protein